MQLPLAISAEAALTEDNANRHCTGLLSCAALLAPSSLSSLTSDWQSGRLKHSVSGELSGLVKVGSASVLGRSLSHRHMQSDHLTSQVTMIGKSPITVFNWLGVKAQCGQLLSPHIIQGFLSRATDKNLLSKTTGGGNALGSVQKLHTAKKKKHARINI